MVGYWAERDVDKARELGAVGAAGDLFVDGSLGSHTACLHQPYADAGHTGTAHLDAADVAAHLEAVLAVEDATADVPTPQAAAATTRTATAPAGTFPGRHRAGRPVQDLAATVA